MKKYTLIWSPKSKDEYASLLGYIEQLYGTDAALRFLDQVEKIAAAVESLPYAFPSSEKVPSLRKAIINKQNITFLG
jgi:plasmid stabilization system protein ParE